MVLDKKRGYLHVQRDHSRSSATIYLWYIPLYIILPILIVLYVIILIKIYCYKRRKWSWNQAHEDSHQQKKITKQIWSLLWYPLIFILINVVPLINRIDGLVDPNNPKLVIWMLTAILLPIQGGFIALAYTLLDPDTRKRLKPARFKSAIKDFCQNIGKGSDVMEYPLEHVEYSTSVAVYYSAADENGIKYVGLSEKGLSKI